MSSKKRGRPIKGDRARTMMLWIPKPLAEQVRESIEADVPFKLRGLPKYNNKRVHMRVPDNLQESIKQGIELWRREPKG